jgi:hypothetical protein
MFEAQSFVSTICSLCLTTVQLQVDGGPSQAGVYSQKYVLHIGRRFGNIQMKTLAGRAFSSNNRGARECWSYSEDSTWQAIALRPCFEAVNPTVVGSDKPSCSDG